MSALPDCDPQNCVEEAGRRVWQFRQPRPVQSYLLALAVGAVQARRIGPRSQVWAEPQLLDKAAYDFSETENMLATAEELPGKNNL